MSGISPLESIHKKGLFGDHHKKDKNELLTIRELKNINIIQIFHHKNSKINLNKINIDGLELSAKTSKVTSNENTRILWNAPSTWFVISKKTNILNSINEKCDDDNFAVTNISHSRAVIQIRGLQTKEVLKKGCPINFNDFEKNSCVGSIFHGITIVVDCVDIKPYTFNILTLRSFGESLYHHITDASLEFGYLGI